jgi:hypothetical protein
MKSKIIVMAGLSRGGTNILWNLMQSHPEVCSPIYETNVILDKGMLGFATYRRGRPKLKKVFYNKLAGQVIASPFVRPFIGTKVSQALFDLKMKNFDHINNGTKFENVPYTKAEVEESILCMKGVDEDIYWSDLFRSLYQESHFVGIIRNGYSWCNGWLRRGRSAEETGKAYQRFGSYMIEYVKSHPNSKVFRFEDVFQDPFKMAGDLYEFTDLSQVHLEKLRLKSKRVVSSEGAHDVRFGSLNEKYWFDHHSVQEILDPTIDQRQSALLSDVDRKAFEKYAMPVLEHFHYN